MLAISANVSSDTFKKFCSMSKYISEAIKYVHKYINTGVTVHKHLLNFHYKLRWTFDSFTYFCYHEQFCYEDSHIHFCLNTCFNLGMYISRSGFIKPDVMHVWWKFQTMVHRKHTSLHFHEQYFRLIISLHNFQH